MLLVEEAGGERREAGAQRLGIGTNSLAEAMSRNPLMAVLPVNVSEQDWQKIVAYYLMYFENMGQYKFQPYAFSVASGNQWNVMAPVDLNNDGWPDVIVGSMDLGSNAKFQRQYSASPLTTAKDPILFFENAFQPRLNQGAH